jgi:large subunit ribosomal protein L4
MMKVKVYNQKGEATGEIELLPELFEVASNRALLHEVVVAQQANSREVIAHAKDRSEVRGGGRKPWRQKGTGRARAGTIRSPLWKGGGVTFGPTKDRNFTKRVNKKVKQKALAMTLSDKAATDRFIVIDSMELPEAKTKAFIAIYKNLPVSGKKTLVVTDSKNTKAIRAIKNLPKVNSISASSLNVVDLLAHDYVLIAKDTVDLVNKTYAGK